MFRFIQSRLKSFGFAFKGIATLITSQPNAWIHVVAMIVVSIAGILLKCNTSEWAILLLTFGAVFAAEAINTAIEFLTDLVSPDYHPLAGKVKDVAAAAVLIMAIAAVGVGLFIFLPKLLVLF